MRLLRVPYLCAVALAASVLTSAAADMVGKAAPNYTAPTTTSDRWSGFYVGGSVGGSWIDSDPSFGTKLSGFTYGGHVGIQKQVGWLVGGIEAGITNFSNVKANGFGCDCLVADLVAKLGVTLTPNTLLYVDGGGFWHNAATGGFLPQFGWVVGGGIDWMPFNEHIVVGIRGEYRDLKIPNTNFEVFGYGGKAHIDYKF